MKTTTSLASLFLLAVLCINFKPTSSYPFEATLVQIDKDQYDCPDGYFYLTNEDNHAYNPSSYDFMQKVSSTSECICDDVPTNLPPSNEPTYGASTGSIYTPPSTNEVTYDSFPISNTNSYTPDNNNGYNPEPQLANSCDCTNEPAEYSDFLSCHLLEDDDTARISGGGSQDGKSLSCANRSFDTKALKSALCIQYTWEDVKSYDGGECPEDTTALSLGEVANDIDKYCAMVDEWGTVNIGNGATLSGKSYDCDIDITLEPAYYPSLCGKRVLKDMKEVSVEENVCGYGKSLITVTEVKDYSDYFCELLGDEEATRLSGGATLRKTSDNCTVYENDKRSATSALCGPDARDYTRI